MDTSFLHSIFHKVDRYKHISTNEEYIIESTTEEKSTNKVSSVSAFWNICNSIQGVAILAMPYVIKGGGWWSVVAMVIIAAVSNYTGNILLQCHYENVKNDETGEMLYLRTRKSYADIGGKVWPSYGKDLVLIVQVLELLFMATLYPIVAASVMKMLCPGVKLTSSLWILVFGFLVLPNVFIRHVNHIALISTVTVASASFVFLVVTLYCFTEYKQWQVERLNDFSTNEFMAACGVIIASYSSQMYLSVIEADMRHPEEVNLVMNAAYMAMTGLKIGIGVVAYVTFGTDTSQVVTLNLPSGFLLTIVNIVVIMLALSSYTLPMFTIFEIFEKDSPWLITGDCSEFLDNTKMTTISPEKIDRKLHMRRTIIRVGLVAITLVMAISVPHFCLVLAFIGSLTGACLEMVFPCVIHLMLKKATLFQRSLNVSIIIASSVFMVTGTYFSGVAVEKAFRTHTSEIWTVDK